jgi:ADP-ribose pyrophosphatase YjhB (NUDIX family)
VQIRFTAPKLNLMNVTSRYGFKFHHASPTGYVLMCLWMDPTTANRIPAYADHYVGVGGVIINAKGEILLIQERRDTEPRNWKFPGGFMDPGETIKQAAEREVLEETGVKTQFQGILGIREMLKARYNASDLYVVCLMHCNDENLAINIIDKREVIEAKWVPLAELTSNDEGAKYRMFPNAYRFIKLLHQRLMANKPLVDDSLSATDLMKHVTLTHEEAVPTSGPKDKPWNYYIGEALKAPKL